MDIGALVHDVELQNPNGPPTADGDGGYTQAYQTLAALWWCAIAPATNRELERSIAGTVLSTATHVVKMRYLPGVTTKTRLVWGSRILNVLGVADPEEQNIMLVLACAEIVE